MSGEIFNIGLAFLEGFALIISPCILPVLPIILTGSLTGSKARPLGIIVGFIIAFTIVTLFSRALIEYLHLDPNLLRNLAFVILLLLGVIMLSSRLTEKFTALTGRLANVGSRWQSVNDTQGGFGGGLLFGSLIGLVWTPCAGPILATVIVQVVIQKTTLSSVLTVLAFGIGAGLPMLLIALLGRRLLEKVSFLKTKANFFRKILGLIIIASVFFLMFESSATFSLMEVNKNEINHAGLINKLETPYATPEIAGISAWINSKPLTLEALKGKVVLIDFWTYSCINCIRTLPYIKDWYAKYHDKGLVIIGVHSPEFQFEHDLDNVKRAVTKFGITYPVALDNQFATWQNFKNQFWPAHYLIDQNGQVVYQHFGEGEYDTTENNIRYLLGLTGGVEKKPEQETFVFGQTPETYLGYLRMEKYASPEGITQNHSANYTYPLALAVNQWALQGGWIINADKIVATTIGASIKIRFYASKVFAVLGAVNNKPVTVRVMLNDKALVIGKGSDVTNSQVKVINHQLFSIIELPQSAEGELELIAAEPGLEVYTFTFGG